MKYINAEKLIAEIKRLHKAHSGKYGCDEVGLNLEYLEDFIDSLQHEQTEVDLEEELDKFYGTYRKDGKTYDIEDDEECVDWKEMCNPYFEIDFARHFYKLGKNSK